MNDFSTGSAEFPANASNPREEAGSVDRNVPPGNPREPSIAPLLAGLDLLAQGVALIDDDGRLRYANKASQACLARAGWTLDCGRLHAPDAALRASWLAALRRVCLTDRRQLFALTGHRSGCVLALIPMHSDGHKRVFASFGRETVCGALELQMFASEHSLTLAECRVLEKLCAGMTSTEIAKIHGVARTTILSQVAAIRAKTLSHSVRQVIAMVSRLPPMRAAIDGTSLATARYS